MHLQGILPALTTPFTDDGGVALDKLRENIGLYNRVPLAGYLSVGSTGESALLSFEEVERIWGATREAAAPGKIVIAGTGVDATAETIRRTRRAAELGFDAALVKTPHYFRPQMTAAALEEHYRRVADASPIPVLLYSVPQYTGVVVTPEMVARLAEHPNIAGIKESSGNVQLAAEIVNATPAEFCTLVGSASTLLGSLSMGAAGGILALACFLPQQAVEIYEAFKAKDFAGAARLQRAILSASRKIVAEFGIAGVKYAMDCAGYFGGAPRPPLLALDQAQKRIVESILAETVPAAAAQAD
jgi:4-hydroxy-tetrahydrodipicolinate synthase